MSILFNALSCNFLLKCRFSPKMWKNHEHSFSNFELVVRKQSSRPQISDLNSDDDEKIIKRKYRNCTKCPARIAVDQYKEHTASHSIPCNPLKCIKCGFELKNEATFNEHMDFHDTSLPLECVICKQNGIRRMAIHKRNLRVHVRRHHVRHDTTDYLFEDELICFF